MTINFFGKYFKISLVAIFFAEIISLLGYLFTSVNQIFFFALVLAVLVLSLVKLEYGVYALLAELFIGSKGYLFFVEYIGAVFSLRLALFLVVMAVWFWNFLKNRKTEFAKSGFIWYYGLTFLAIVWGAANGFWRNEFSNVFFDLNAWFYFALVLPFYDSIKSKKQVHKIMEILVASTLALSLKTLALLYIFSHNLWFLQYAIYRWVRTTGVGEITRITPSFSRIFIQSQVYNLILIFILFCLMVFLFRKLSLQNKTSIKKILKNKNLIYLSLLAILSLAVLLVSLSRSFWAGGFLTAVIFAAVWLYTLRSGKNPIIKPAAWFLALILLSIGLVYSIGNFPYPAVSKGFGLNTLGDRATSFTGEAGASSRWNLLPELWEEIKKNPLGGGGFGRTATYKSSDPRILASSADGLYTTYAFEWGYLDIWLKLGFFGLIAYLSLLGKIWQKGWTLFKQYRQERVGFLLWGLLLGLAVVAATSIFSPYLNHPLGIGYLLLVSAVFEAVERSGGLSQERA